MLNSDPLPWLLEDDTGNPGIKYFALRDLLGAPEDSVEVRRARKAIMEHGPVPRILAAQQSEGNWIPNRGKYINSVWHYQSTVWQIVFLAELGADPQNKQIRLGCQYLLEHTIAANHAFSGAQPPIPSQSVHCMNGHLLLALPRLGFSDDGRVAAAFDWMAKAITGELAPNQYFKSGTSGPTFACGVNLRQPCGWGATKAMRALVSIPEADRTPAMQRAVQVGANFLLSHDLATANFPYTNRISPTWFKFGFPLSYWSDILETTQVLIDLGYGKDQRLAAVMQLISGKRNGQGRWKMENSLNGKMWNDIETKGQPSKWITLRALRGLKGAGLALAG
jgi:hypothetical protein